MPKWALGPSPNSSETSPQPMSDFMRPSSLWAMVFVWWACAPEQTKSFAMAWSSKEQNEASAQGLARSHEHSR
eukprot:2735962-Alexandrium_andersonii.AAC.1